jgi:rod shape-determining protein MreC
VSIELAPKKRESHGIFLLILLLLLHLTLLSLQVEDPSGGILLKKWVLVAGAPFINFSAAVSHGLRNVWENYIWLRGARAENAQLQQTVRQLSLHVIALEQMRQENLRLKTLLSFGETSQFRSIGARVVGRAPDFLSQVVYLDRGSADHVQLDCPVVTGDGIVGRVVLVAAGNSQVQLITNADASVGVLIQRTGYPGVLRGTGGHLLEVGYIGSTEDVQVDDLIVTSGLDRIYPKGLPVGKVVESTKGKTVFRNIRVQPSVDLLRINEALILLGGSSASGEEGMTDPGDSIAPPES